MPAKSTESNLSRTPPCPGNNRPESLTRRSRLMADSNRSPHCPASPTMRPRNAACSKDNQGEYILTTKAKSTDPINSAKAPSIVFFGDICGAILRFPNARPTKKEAVSLLHVHPVSYTHLTLPTNRE